MNTLLNALQNTPTTRTTNGMPAHGTTHDYHLDLFGAAGSLRKDPAKVEALFANAYHSDRELAGRIAQWLRDVRGGAGEREAFRRILAWLAIHDVQAARWMAPKVAEVGRWDDLLVLIDTKAEDAALREIATALQAGNQLCAKWLPRKGIVAVKLREQFGLTPKQYRKLLVSLTNVVETKMCAKQWSTIEFGKIPSLAAARYQKAFTRNAPGEYQKYVDSLVKGEAKINASAIFPHDVIVSAQRGTDAVASVQWHSLPNYMQDGNERVLPLIDVSGSMSTPINQGSRGHGRDVTTCMDVAVGLGMYCAERMSGPFKNHFITFHSDPQLVRLADSPSLLSRVQQIKRSPWGMNTNFIKALNLILETARSNNCPESDMPTMLIVLSDMQFDHADGSCSRQTAFSAIKTKYQLAGYEMPKIVFWNLNAVYSNSPITMHASGACLVSGFSPALLSPIFSAKQFNPRSVMLEAVMGDRYAWIPQ